MKSQRKNSSSNNNNNKTSGSTSTSTPTITTSHTKQLVLKDHDAVFGRKCGLRVPNTRFKALIGQHSGAYCAIVQHLAQEKKTFVLAHVMNPLTKQGGRFFLSSSSGVKQLLVHKPKDLQLIITKIQQALRDEKKKLKKGKGTSSSSSRNNNKNNAKRDSARLLLPQVISSEPPQPLLMTNANDTSTHGSGEPESSEHEFMIYESVQDAEMTTPPMMSIHTSAAQVSPPPMPPLFQQQEGSSSDHSAAEEEDEEDQEEEGTVKNPGTTSLPPLPLLKKQPVAHEEIDIAMVKELFEALRGGIRLKEDAAAATAPTPRSG